MSELGKFIAFEAAMSLHRERGNQALLDQVLADCRAAVAAGSHAHAPGEPPVNHVKRIYAAFSDAEISARVADLVRPPGWDGELKVVFQTVAGLRNAIPHHTGDWYFTGDYPTPGGTRVCNRAFINYMERKTGRAYEAVVKA
jgi:amidophosphoribosyltransferase